MIEPALKEEPVLATLSVITPSYRPDAALCRDLNRSLRLFAPPGTSHCVIVPRADRGAFDGISDVRAVDEYLPRNFLRIPGNMWINVRYPFPPVRGWIVQQILKLEAAAQSAAEVALLVDSDTVFIRPFSAETFLRNGETRFFRVAGAIHQEMTRHILWHRTARRLLGLQPSERLPLNDYICWPMAWNPEVVRSMLHRVEKVAGTNWQCAIARQLHFSEGILYGVYVDEIMGGAAYSADTMLSIGYSDEVPLDEVMATNFVSSASASDIAVMISAKSNTTSNVRNRVLEILASA